MATAMQHLESQRSMMPATLVIVCATLSLFLQGIAETTGITATAERLTLAGALVVAVGVLWKAVAKKDDQILDMSKAVTDALRATANSNTELREIIKDSIRAKDELTKSIDALKAGLGTLPCVNEPDVRPPHMRK